MTVDETVDRGDDDGRRNRGPSTRTMAATVARKRAGSKRLAGDLGPRVHLLDNEMLSALAGVLLAELDRRGLPVPEPDETD